MPATLNFGPRLSNDEYQRKVVELHSVLPPLPTRAQDELTRRRELDLAIDYRLGREFPHQRRDALWAIQQRVESKRLRLSVKHWLAAIFGQSAHARAEGVAGYMISEYSKVLSEAEVASFFDLPPGQPPRLPRSVRTR